MNIGKIRRARLGEVPTHYATENIRANEAVVATLHNQLQDNMRRGVIPILDIRRTQRVDLHVKVEHEDESESRTTRIYVWTAIIIAAPLLLLLVVRIIQQIIGILTGGSI